MSDISARSARDKWIQGVHARRKQEMTALDLEDRRERWAAEDEARQAAEAEEEKRRKERLDALLEEAARPRKILVSGDCRGSLAKLFGTVEAQAAKAGPFNVLLSVGAFLPESSSLDAGTAAYFSGGKDAPLETYFIDAGAALLQSAPEGHSFGKNLHFLGGYGVRQVCGLRVAFLSGRYDPAVYAREDVDFVGQAYTARAVSALQTLGLAETGRQKGVDVLLTCDWPADIDQKLAEDAQRPTALEGSSWQVNSSPPIAELVHALEPRYHIFGSADLFYQRLPFKAPRRGHACRCIGLGSVGSSGKQRKWLHALALGPMGFMKPDELKALPAGTTPPPFVAGKSRPSAPMAAADPEAERAAKRRRTEPSDAHEADLPSRSLAALLAGDGDIFAAASRQLARTPLLLQAPSSVGDAAATAPGVAADAAGGTSAEAVARNAAATAVTAEEEVPADVAAAREAARAFLKNKPAKGVVRYTFSTEGPLGLRLSRDVPPWILEVRDGTLAYKKVPRVPLGGVVVAVNGYELTESGSEEAMKGLTKRPVVLDVLWPEDQGKPTVNRA